jgi:hypothetical protein
VSASENESGNNKAPEKNPQVSENSQKTGAGDTSLENSAIEREQQKLATTLSNQQEPEASKSSPSSNKAAETDKNKQTSVEAETSNLAAQADKEAKQAKNDRTEERNVDNSQSEKPKQPENSKQAGEAVSGPLADIDVKEFDRELDEKKQQSKQQQQQAEQSASNKSEVSGEQQQQKTKEHQKGSTGPLADIDVGEFDRQQTQERDQQPSKQSQHQAEQSQSRETQPAKSQENSKGISFSPDEFVKQHQAGESKKPEYGKVSPEVGQSKQKNKTEQKSVG